MNYSLLMAVGIILALVVLLIGIAYRLRRRGGSMVTTVLGATDAFYHGDKKKAIEIIVEHAAGQKTEEDTSSEPEHREQ